MPEDGSASFQVQLSAQPTLLDVDVTVRMVGFPGSDIYLVGGTNRFTFSSLNWDVGRTVTVRARADDDSVNSTATIRLTGRYGSLRLLPTVEVTALERDTDYLLRLSASREEENLWLHWNGLPETAYTMEWSTNLSDWHEIPVGVATEWTDPTWTEVSQKFYRLRTP